MNSLNETVADVLVLTVWLPKMRISVLTSSPSHKSCHHTVRAYPWVLSPVAHRIKVHRYMSSEPNPQSQNPFKIYVKELLCYHVTDRHVNFKK